MNIQEIYGEAFKKDVCEWSSEIDPSGEYDWYALSLGWAIAKGLTVEDVHSFAIWVRYTKHYWQ